MGKPIGFLNPLIYQQAVEAAAFHDVSDGGNGTFDAAQGWDPCTGLGSPDGNQLLGALTGQQPQAMTTERMSKAKKTAA
jgi:kumamolisin